MIIHAFRISPFMSQCAAGLTRRINCQGSRSAVPSPNASFSSMPPQQLQTPFHPYTSPKGSILPPIQRLSKTKIDPKNAKKKIRTIKDFVDRIPAAVHLRKTENIQPGAFDDPVARLFRRTDLPPHAWKKYSLFDNNKPYTRNLISTDHESYTLLLLCWNPEKESPIHDHPCDGCWLQVLEGGIREIRYDRQLNNISQIDCREGGLSYITDNVGYHKVGNPTQTPAVTLHLYSPPFETCKCWHSEHADPSQPSEGKSVNHSEYGKVLKVA